MNTHGISRLVVAAAVLSTACGDVEQTVELDALQVDASIDAVVADAADVDTPEDAAIDAPDAMTIEEPPLLLPAGAIVMFDGGCPSGFQERTDLANLYLRGHDADATYGENGGADIHTHTVGAHAHGTGMAGMAHAHTVQLVDGVATVSVYFTTAGGSPGVASQPGHDHPAATSSTGGGPHPHTLTTTTATTSSSVQNLPLYRESVLCEVVTATAVLPATALLLAETSCAVSWSEVTAFRNRLLRGDDLDGTLGEIGGIALHAHSFPDSHGTLTMSGGDHTHSVGTSTATDSISITQGNAVTLAGGSHTHGTITFTGTHTHAVAPGTFQTSNADMMPEYREVVTCNHASGPTELPASALLMFDGPCPTDWVEVNAFRNRFIGGHNGNATAAENLGGVHTHDATHDPGMTGAREHSHNFLLPAPSTTIGGSTTGTNRDVVRDSHTHTAVVSSEDSHSHDIDPASPVVSGPSTLPRYHEVVVCRMQ